MTIDNFGALVGTHDIVFMTLDALRYDIADQQLRAGNTPTFARLFPQGWERRHTPASFTLPAHHAFFAGFLPTPTTPGPHPRLFAATFPGSESTGEDTWTFPQQSVVSALQQSGYATVCVGGVGFFNPNTSIGEILPGYFEQAYWDPSTGVTDPGCFGHQIDIVRRIVKPMGARPLFLFVNVAAIHQPNRWYVPGTERDTLETHAAALRYVDALFPQFLDALAPRQRPLALIVCSDHGTAYGEDGHFGHRVGLNCVWTVPYADTVITR